MPDLTEFSDSARRLALERYRKLQPHLEQNVPLLQVARAAALPIRTARRWVHRYRHFGLAGLTRRGRADHGKRRSISPTLLNLVEGLALQKPSLPVAAVYREACRIALAQGERLPGYHSVYRAINTVPPALKTLAHEGEKAYREAYDLLHRREAARPNEIWQADHTQLDLWAKRDGGQVARPWLTIIIDDHSRAIAGLLLLLRQPFGGADSLGVAPGDLAKI